MENSNALISMALVSHNSEDPYTTFCEYIKYCIFINSSEKMQISDLQKALEENFDIHIPYNIIIACLRKLRDKKVLTMYEHTIKRMGEFDTNKFEAERVKYKEVEESLIDALVASVSQYDKTWNKDYAREQLIKVLDRNGLAHDIFLHKGKEKNSYSVCIPDEDEVISVLDNGVENEEGNDQPLFSDSYLVAKFIKEVLETRSPHYDYLQKVCEGLMICVGTYQIPSADCELTLPQISNTEFFFDTRLLLRIVGCAGEAAINASHELVSLIQKSGGKIYYYSHTFEEADNALGEAIRSVANGYAPYDNEMRIYSARVGNNLTVLKAKKASLSQELQRLKIYKKNLDGFSESDRIKFGFDANDLEQFMIRHLSWEQRTIKNDALSIWYTHMKREGKYIDYFGTREKLPIFVTTNPRLIDIALKYRDERPSTNEIADWRPNRLPVITDVRLTCRLWSPAVDAERISLLYLTSNVMAAQRPTQRYLNSIRELSLQLRETIPAYSSIPLASFFDDNVTSAVFNQTNGSDEMLNIESFASTINELSEFKAKEQEKLTEKAESERDNISRKFDEQRELIISDAVEKNKNHMGFVGFLLWSIIHWPTVATIPFGIGSAIISYFCNNLTPLLGIIIPLFLFIVEKIISACFIAQWLLKALFKFIENCYKMKISKGLQRAELQYEEEIITATLNETKLIRKAREIMQYK